jgi:hypothetical protein
MMTTFVTRKRGQGTHDPDQPVDQQIQALPRREAMTLTTRKRTRGARVPDRTVDHQIHELPRRTVTTSVRRKEGIGREGRAAVLDPRRRRRHHGHDPILPVVRHPVDGDAHIHPAPVPAEVTGETRNNFRLARQSNATAIYAKSSSKITAIVDFMLPVYTRIGNVI